MSNRKQLVIITNDRIFEKEKNFFCDNIDLKSIPEGVSKKLDVFLIVLQTHSFGFPNFCMKTILWS